MIPLVFPAGRSASWTGAAPTGSGSVASRADAKQPTVNAADELAPSSSTAVEPADDIIRLRSAISRLNLDQRELLHLYYDLERSVGEIAAVLAIPTGTVKSRLFFCP